MQPSKFPVLNSHEQVSKIPTFQNLNRPSWTISKEYTTWINQTIFRTRSHRSAFLGDVKHLWETTLLSSHSSSLSLLIGLVPRRRAGSVCTTPPDSGHSIYRTDSRSVRLVDTIFQVGLQKLFPLCRERVTVTPELRLGSRFCLCFGPRILR